MKNEARLLSLLGMCRRAGKLSCGHDAAIGSLKNRSAALCILSSDASRRLREEMERELNFSHSDIPILTLDSTMEEIGHATGLRSAVLTVNDAGFARSMQKLTETTDGEVTE